MSRTLKRPMFRRGGSTNNGIMTGLTDRKQYAEGKTLQEYMKEAEAVLPKQEATRFPIGQIGLNLISGQFAGDGLLRNLAGSAQDPYAQFVKADDAMRNIDYQTKMAATKMGISRAEAEAKPDKTSVLAAEKKAKILLRNEGKELTSENIIKKTSEIIQSEMRGKTYGAEANLERAISSYRSIYGEGSKAYNHAAFDTKVAPALRAVGKNPRANIKFKDGKYKTKGKSPGVYIDVENGKVIEFDGNVAVELKEYSALLR
jgi:hypothetical protein